MRLTQATLAKLERLGQKIDRLKKRIEKELKEDKT
jgi:hypothetical protein